MKLTKKQIIKLLEGALFAEGKPISLETLRKRLPFEPRPPLGEIREILEGLQNHYKNRGVELVEVASGYRFQVAPDVAEHLIETREEKPTRFSKAFMETLALVAYRQPITRGEIEDIRGVAVNSNIIKGLLELEWIREVGQKQVPGKPALFATTKKFLDFFNLKSLDELPPLAELEELSETRLQEEFDKLDDELKVQMGDVEKLADVQREAKEPIHVDPNFVGPLPVHSKNPCEEQDEGIEVTLSAEQIGQEALNEAGDLETIQAHKERPSHLVEQFSEIVLTDRVPAHESQEPKDRDSEG